MRKTLACCFFIIFLCLCPLALGQSLSFDEAGIQRTAPLAATKDALYLYNQQWDKATGQLSPFTMPEAVYHLVSDGAALYAIGRDTIWEAVPNESTFTLQNPLPLQLDNLGEDPYTIGSAFIMEGQLFMFIRSAFLEDIDVMYLHRFNLDTGSHQLLFASKTVISVAPYKEGRLLTLNTDAQVQPYDLAMKKPGQALFTLPSLNAGGLAYDAKTDTIFAACSGGVYKQTGNGQPQLIAYLPISYFDQDTRATLIGSELFAIADRKAVYFRDANGTVPESQTLRISGANFDMYSREGFDAFQLAHQEISIIMNTSNYFHTAQALYADFLTDTASDIYGISDPDLIRALAQKGYCADLSESPVLKQAAENMYPNISAPFYQDGHLYAYPYIAITSGRPIFAWEPNLLKTLGYTQADVPKDISGLLDFCMTLCATGALEANQLVLLNHALWYNSYRELFLVSILQQRMGQCIAAGQPLTFDTPLIRAALHKLDEATPALDELKGLNTKTFIFAQDPIDALFICDYGLITPDNTQGNETYVLWPFLLESDQPATYAAGLSLLFVNPHSKVKDQAIALIESIAATPDVEARYLLFKTEKDPLPDPEAQGRRVGLDCSLLNYDQMIARAQTEEDKAYIASLKQSEIDYFQRYPISDYLVSPDNLAIFLDIAPHFYMQNRVTSFFALSENLQSQYQRYLAMEITPSQFLDSIDKVLKKIEAESK